MKAQPEQLRVLDELKKILADVADQNGDPTIDLLTAKTVAITVTGPKGDTFRRTATPETSALAHLFAEFGDLLYPGTYKIQLEADMPGGMRRTMVGEFTVGDIISYLRPGMEGFEIEAQSIGHIGHRVLSVHLTAGKALPEDGAILTYLRGEFGDTPGGKPYAYQKILSAAIDPAGVAKQMNTAIEQGFIPVLQLRDDEPNGIGAPDNVGRSEVDAIAITESILNQLDGFGFPTEKLIIAYINEPWITLKGLDPGTGPQTVADVQAAVFAAVKDRVAGFGMSNTSSWQRTATALALQVAALDPAVLAKIDHVSAHHYNGQGSLPVEHGYRDLLGGMLPAGVEVMMGEGDATLPEEPNAEILWDYRGATWVIDHNLALATAGMHCCDFTVQNEGPTAFGGNGLFLFNGTPNPSGAAFVDVLAPFCKSPALRVTRETSWGAASVYANMNREVIITNFIGDPDKTSEKWMRMSSLGVENDHVDWNGEVLPWLQGIASQPTYAPEWEPDWDALQVRYDQAHSDADADYKDIAIRLPDAARGHEILSTVDDGIDHPKVAVTGKNIVARMPPNTSIYLKIR